MTEAEYYERLNLIIDDDNAILLLNEEFMNNL